MDLVFVHFNTKLPRHLELNIERSLRLFPMRNVHLLTDQDVGRLRRTNLRIHRLSQDNRWHELNSSLIHPKDFRGNFWLTSLARFFALSDFAEAHKAPFLHIESDVLISNDFPFDTLSELKCDLAFPIVSNSQAIASTLYIRNHSAAKELANYSLKCSRENSSTTDMLVLYNFMTEFPDLATILPSAFSHARTLESLSCRQKVIDSEMYFKAAFDGFDFGRFLFGDDPRNARGFSILRKKDPNSFLDVGNLTLVTTENRTFPSIRRKSDGELIPLHSLHIHSKNLSVFRFKKETQLIKRAVENSSLPPQKIFVFTVFCKSAMKAIWRRIRRVINL
jgi:hypothetical protein